MTLLGWLASLLAAFGLVLFASTRAVFHVRQLAQASRVPPFFIGFTLLAVGTDLPEIANSIAACVAGFGDLNAGDSIGSAVTQSTLILGMLPFLCGAFAYQRARVFIVTGASVAALALGAVLLSDGLLSRADGVVLLVVWVVGSVVIWRRLPPAAEPIETVAAGNRVYHAAAALAFLALVAVGAAIAVMAFVRLSALFGVPQYLLSFFVASIGTSLPELVVDVTALRSGMRDVALGDVLGSSFVDTTLSMGIGPLVAPASVTASVAVFGSVTAIAVLSLVALTLGFSSRHTWRTGSMLLLLYVGVYFVLLA